MQTTLGAVSTSRRKGYYSLFFFLEASDLFDMRVSIKNLGSHCHPALCAKGIGREPLRNQILCFSRILNHLIGGVGILSFHIR